MIGYPRRQDGAILPARDYPPCPARRNSQKPYNKSFIDQVCAVKMAGYWPRSFFCEFIDLDCVLVHKHAKKELGQYPAILTLHLVNNPYIWHPDEAGPVIVDCLVQNHKQNPNLVCTCFLMMSFVFAPAANNKPNLQNALTSMTLLMDSPPLLLPPPPQKKRGTS